MAYDIDYKKVRKLASIHCTQREIASIFDIPFEAFRNLVRNDPLLKEAIETGMEYGKASLRRLQWRHASGFGPAAVAMTIHLSKHWLGETDRSTLEIDGSIRVEHGLATGGSDKILQGINPALLEAQEQIELNDLCDRLDEVGLIRLSEPQRVRFFELVSKAGGEDSVARKPAPILALPPPSSENTVE